MSSPLDDLQSQLEGLAAEHALPLLRFTTGRLVFYLRDLSADEEAHVGEYAYAQVPDGQRTKLTLDSAVAEARNLRALVSYRMAYAAAAIRYVGALNPDGSEGKLWDVSGPLTGLLHVRGEEVSKFFYFLALARSWVSDLHEAMYQGLADQRVARAPRDRAWVRVEEVDAPPRPPEVSSYRRVEDPADAVEDPDVEVAAEAARVAGLRAARS